MKKTLSMILALVLLLGAVPFAVPAAAADAPVSGTCGDNITWTLEDGVLTVSGDGAIEPVHMHNGTEWYSSWNEATGKFQTVTVDTENDGFPWTSILRQIDSTYLGNERWDRADVVKRLYDGTLDVNRYWDATTNAVKKIVIEEGITSIAEGAFYEFIPEEIYLPSTVESLGKDAFSPALSTKIVVKNPALDFSNGVLLFGCNAAQNGIPAWFETKEAYAQSYLRFLEADVPLTYLPHDVARTLATAVALKEGYGDEDFASYVLDPYEADGIDTPDELIETILGIYNSILGTNYTSANEILFPAPECTCETCTHGTCLDCKRAGCNCCDCKDFNNRAVEFNNNYTLYAFTDEFYNTCNAAIEAAHTEDLLEYINGTSTYYLGDAPQATDENDHVLDLTPVPWLTVYGYAGSTAETAAQTSSVNFVALDADDTVWETVDGKLRAYGTCGDNCTWTLEDGVLTVSGDGAIEPIVPENGQDEDQSPYYPWNKAIQNLMAEKTGVFPDGSGNFEVKVLLDQMNLQPYFTEFRAIANSVVVTEGITEIPHGAFSVVDMLPDRVILPASLEQVEEEFVNMALTRTLVFYNADYDFSAHPIRLFGGELGKMAASPEGALAFFSNVVEADCMRAGVQELAGMAYEFSGKEDSPEALAELNSTYGWAVSSCAEASALLISIINEKLGTAFQSADELLVENGVNLVLTPAFDAALQPLRDAVTAAQESEYDFETFRLGEELAEGISPTPWLTVYGYSGSTAETAAQTSGVNFVALDADDTVWETVDGKLRAYGTCGDNCTWSIENDVLSINGDGAVHARKRVNSKGELELYFPWNDVVIRALYEQYGTFEEEAFIAGVLSGAIDPVEYLTRLAVVYNSLIIGEGITSFDAHAFDREFTPQGHVLTSAKTIVLPSTLTTMPDSMLEAGFANTLIVKNPSFDFAASKIWLDGYFEADGMPASAEESFEQALNVNRAAYAYSIPLEWAEAIYSFSYEPASQETLANVNASFGWNASSFEEAAALAVAALNDCIGTDFTSAAQIVIPTEDGFDYTPAFETALQPLKDAYDAALVLNENSKYYYLGNVPQWEESGVTTDMIPISWLTVLGPSGSAVQTAAETSGVNFQPLCPVNVNHTVIQKAETALTCTEAGVSAGWYCEDCGRYLSGGEVINPTGHRHTRELGEIEPTRHEHGRTAGVYCDDCMDYVTGGEIIHNKLGASEIIKEPTETEEGEAEIYCTVCGEKGLYAIEKLEPQPEEPGDNGGNDKNDDDNFFRRLANGIINFFLRLIKWLGGGK